MNILSVVENLVEKHGTRNPFTIADKCGVYVYCESLGTVNGYYNTAFGVKSIHINEKLSQKMKELTCAHELGHAIMHPNLNINFMTQKTFMLPGKYEQQANLFASYLLFPPDVLKEYEGFSVKEIASILEVPQRIISIRMEN